MFQLQWALLERIKDVHISPSLLPSVPCPMVLPVTADFQQKEWKQPALPGKQAFCFPDKRSRKIWIKLLIERSGNNEGKWFSSCNICTYWQIIWKRLNQRRVSQRNYPFVLSVDGEFKNELTGFLCVFVALLLDCKKEKYYKICPTPPLCPKPTTHMLLPQKHDPTRGDAFLL